MDQARSDRRELENYFLKRLAEEAELAKASPDSEERSAHLRACELLRELLELETDPDHHLFDN